MRSPRWAETTSSLANGVPTIATGTLTGSGAIRWGPATAITVSPPSTVSPASIGLPSRRSASAGADPGAAAPIRCRALRPVCTAPATALESTRLRDSRAAVTAPSIATSGSIRTRRLRHDPIASRTARQARANASGRPDRVPERRAAAATARERKTAASSQSHAPEPAPLVTEAETATWKAASPTNRPTPRTASQMAIPVSRAGDVPP